MIITVWVEDVLTSVKISITFYDIFYLPYRGPQTSHMRGLRLCILKAFETSKDAVNKQDS